MTANLAFEAATALARDIGDDDWLLDSLCGRARCALACGAVTRAAGLVEELMHIAASTTTASTNPFSGATEHQIRLTLHEVWVAAGDPRADTALCAAHDYLQAAAIGDELLRYSFLSVVPEHRRTVVLWQAREQPR